MAYGAPELECDIDATPNPITGPDPDGMALARTKFVPGSICHNRLIAIPIIESFPSSGSSEDIMVLGIATFAIAKWDRKAGWGDALGTDSLGTDSPAGACGEPALDSGYPCGMVWGYLLHGVDAPGALLQRISQNDNPLAPNMIALVE
jgi:hypothetical protein